MLLPIIVGTDLEITAECGRKIRCGSMARILPRSARCFVGFSQEHDRRRTSKDSAFFWGKVLAVELCEEPFGLSGRLKCRRLHELLSVNRRYSVRKYRSDDGTAAQRAQGRLNLRMTAWKYHK